MSPLLGIQRINNAITWRISIQLVSNDKIISVVKEREEWRGTRFLFLQVGLTPAETAAGAASCIAALKVVIIKCYILSINALRKVEHVLRLSTAESFIKKSLRVVAKALMNKWSPLIYHHQWRQLAIPQKQEWQLILRVSALIFMVEDNTECAFPAWS